MQSTHEVHGGEYGVGIKKQTKKKQEVKKTQHKAGSDFSDSAAVQQTTNPSGEMSWHLPPRELSKQCLHLFCSLSYILSSEASAWLGICQGRWELSLFLLWCHFFPSPIYFLYPPCCFLIPRLTPCLVLVFSLKKNCTFQDKKQQTLLREWLADEWENCGLSF